MRPYLTNLNCRRAIGAPAASISSICPHVPAAAAVLPQQLRLLPLAHEQPSGRCPASGAAALPLAGLQSAHTSSYVPEPGTKRLLLMPRCLSVGWLRFNHLFSPRAKYGKRRCIKPFFPHTKMAGF